MRSLTLPLLSLGLFTRCRGQDTPILLDGALESATATDSSYNTGGVIRVNGWSVTVPKNLQVGFPAAWVSWKDFIASTGSFGGFEVSIVGNIVNGQPIAGQIDLSQFFTQGGQGYISQINFDGSMKIANGPTIRINDPNAVYSGGYTVSPFMTADDQNPSISSFSGFPMCVPRNGTDPLCPQSQRPNIQGTNSKQGTLGVPDPLIMAPFQVGDYVEYSGFWSGGEVICFQITATNIQITTSGIPSYIRVEDALIGVFTNDANAEEADSRFVGYVSDVAAGPVSIFAIEADVCTGEPTYRQIASAAVDGSEPRNKFEFRFKQPATSRYTREYRLVASGGTKLTKNQILAGQYVQPVTEWIQPELTAPGLRPLPNDFSKFFHLTQGLGRDENGNLWGPLSPFPQSGVTVFDVNSCPPFEPPSSSTTTPSPSTIFATPTTSRTQSPSSTPDTVRVASATWASKQSGTLSVVCTSNNIDNNAVGMVLDYTVGGSTTFNAIMAAGQTGSWTFSNRGIKLPSSVTCRSKLGGSATGGVSS